MWKHRISESFRVCDVFSTRNILNISAFRVSAHLFQLSLSESHHPLCALCKCINKWRNFFRFFFSFLVCFIFHRCSVHTGSTCNTARCDETLYPLQMPFHHSLFLFRISSFFSTLVLFGPVLRRSYRLSSFLKNFSYKFIAIDFTL